MPGKLRLLPLVDGSSSYYPAPIICVTLRVIIELTDKQT